MPLASVSRPASESAEPARPAVRAASPPARLDRLRAAGNRATGRAVARALPVRTVARCAGSCHCGGRCGGPTAEDEDLLAAGQRALHRAVLARDDTRRATPPAPTAPSGGSSAPSSTQTCGPDVTRPLLDVLAATSTAYASWDRHKRQKACDALENYSCAGAAWDIVELHNRDWLDGYAPCADKTGPCKNTVRVDGNCSYAGSVNYVIFGAMCKLCDMWQSTMEDMIWAYKGHVPFVHEASPNYGPSLEWARAGYRGWPAVASPTGDRPTCTGNCPVAYTSPPFRLHWFPASPTETVSRDCQIWSDTYDIEPLPGDFGL
jgi:hypothetical protein